MIVAHLSDLHLGYRAYDRQEQGRNVRELDVERAFGRALEAVVALEPGLVVISGDVFDRPDPSSTAVVALARGLEVLRESLPETPVVMVAGSSDTPLRGGGPGALAAFDTIPGVEAAFGDMRALKFRDGELHVLLVPHRALMRRPPPLLEPDASARWNVLAVRAQVGGGDAGPEAHRGGGGQGRPAGAGVPLGRGDWDYVALGHEHGHRVVAPAMAYAGSLERIGPDPWREAAEEKGFVSADLPTGSVRFHPVGGRPVVELAGIRVRPGDPAHVGRRVREVVSETPGGIDGKIVRMRIQGLPGGAPPNLDDELLESLGSRALHLSVRVDWPSSAQDLPSLESRMASMADDGAPSPLADVFDLLTEGEGEPVA
jgi:DNA repair exonuclease SbcCD nuclease subunit